MFRRYSQILLVSICLSLILMGSCKKEQASAPLVKPLSSYLALGDSYTIGEGVAATERWPAILVDSLEGEWADSITLKYIARTGWTTRNLLNGIAEENLEKYDLVSLLIGVNNQFQNLPFDLFDKELDSLLDLGLSFRAEGGHMFVVSIPDYGVTPFGQANRDSIAAQLDRYNALTKVKCAALEIPYVDITEISRNLENDPESLATDQLHPSGYQYALWVNEILAQVESLLK